MFVHLFAGALIFFAGAHFFGMSISKEIVVAGAFWGVFPDILSMFLQKTYTSGKYCHRHRDNFSHSIFLPLLFWVNYLNGDGAGALLVAISVSSHSFLDLFGIGWGVKLLWPFSKRSLKLFYKGKVFNLFSQEELDEEVMKFGMDDWIKRVYFTFNPIGLSRWWGTLEWFCLLAFIILIWLC